MTKVSQERLSEDDLQKWERIMRKRTDSTSTVVLFLIEDLRKARAAVAERDRYKAEVEIAKGNVRALEDYVKFWESTCIEEQDENKKLRSALEYILEYWNRDENERAMSDALWKIIKIATDALEGGSSK